jgi:hypothetical protein
MGGGAPMHAVVDYEVDGIRRSTAKFFYGIKVPVDEETIGFEKLYKTDNYLNPDYRDCHDFASLHQAMKRTQTALLDRAKFFEMTVLFGFDLFTYTPEFASLLEDPQPDHQIGESFYYENGDLFGEKSLKMMKAVLTAFLETYPQADAYMFSVPEFSRNLSKFEASWKSLCERHPNAANYDIEYLTNGEAAGDIVSGGRQRSVDEAKTTIVFLEMLPRLFEKLGFFDYLKKTGKRAGFIAGLSCPQMMPLISELLWDDAFFISIYGYTASRSLRAARFLDGVRTDRVPVTQVVTLQDDNIGYFQQFTNTSVAALIETGIEHGLSGFMPRFYPIADLDPLVNLLNDVSWNEGVTAERSFSNYVSKLYGSEHAAALCRAGQLVEDATLFLDMNLGLLFPFEGLIDQRMRPGRRNMSDVLCQVHATYKEVAHILAGVAPSLSTDAARRSMKYWRSRIDFAILAFDWMVLLDGVNAALKDSDRALAEARYPAARAKISEALKVLSDNIGDEIDLNALAFYYHALVRQGDARFRELIAAIA